MTASTNPTYEFVKQLGKELASNDFDLPPFPDTPLRVQEALKDPNVSMDKLGGIIMSEPTLTARLLRMSNSAMMRRGTMEITDIKTAIARIGLDMVQNVAVSFAAREAFKAPKGSSLQRQLDATRKHSIEVAALAYVLARRVRGSGKPDEAMLAGLLHGVGKFYILIRAQEFPQLFADEEALASLLEQWHTGVGRAIVESWGFPENIAHAVDEHELIDREVSDGADLSDVILVASLLARLDDKQLTELAELPELEELPSLSRMRVSSGELQRIMDESQEEVRSMVEAMTG